MINALGPVLLAISPQISAAHEISVKMQSKENSSAANNPGMLVLLLPHQGSQYPGSLIVFPVELRTSRRVMLIGGQKFL